jgi:hypothetical protein
VFATLRRAPMPRPVLPLALVAAALLAGGAPATASFHAPLGAAAPPRDDAAPDAPAAPAPDAPAAPAPEAPAGKVPQVVRDRERERSWFVLPMVFWLPETKLGFAASGGLHFGLKGAAHPSNAFLVLGYTVRGQGSVDVASELYLAGGALVSGRFRAVHFPDAFYGIGPETTLEAREELTRRFLELTLAADLPLLPGRMGAGPRVHARAEEVRDLQPGGAIAAGEVAGAPAFEAVGVGVGVTYDTRDLPLWTTRGAFAQASYLYYPASIGRNEGFGRGSAEGRLFLPLGRERTLGLAALLEQTHGETPFTILSKLGSTRYLRGIREGRYRDRLAWAAQAELRVPLAERIAAAAFGAFGDVGPDLRSLRADTLKVAVGGGVRFRLTDAGANLRIDVAASDAGPELYVLLLEAF